MNFKYFIGGLYLFFVALIIFMVFKSCGQDIGLESKDYFNEELKYQSTINSKMRGNSYLDSFVIGEKNNQIVVIQPVSLVADSIKLFFKRPDDAKKDLTFRYNGSKIEAIDKSKFLPGNYEVRITCYVGDCSMIIDKKVAF